MDGIGVARFDAVVVGLGAVGAATLLALARAGARVLGIERFSVGNDQGSHHGHSRVFRHAYFEHPDYVPLLLHSSAAIRRLEAETGLSLKEGCGVLLAGPPDSTLLAASAQSARQWSIPVEALTSAALAARYPQLPQNEGLVGLFEPGGGFLRPEAILRTQVARARALGAEVWTGHGVQELEEGPAGFRGEAGGRGFRADALVLAAGARMPALVPALAPLLRVTREIQAWIQPEDTAAAAPERLPCWLLERPGQTMVYGIPVDPLAEGAPRAKVALHGAGPTVDPETVDRAVHPAEIAALQALARASLPGLPGTVVDAKVCLYTMTPDEHFILDRVPGMDRAFFAAGLSGHGFKLAPALGQALADLALDGRTALPVGFLRLDRLAL